MQFAINAFTGAKLNSVNTRSEQHGDALVPAMDLSWTVDLPNTVLDLFDPELLPALFRSEAADAGVQDIPGVEKALPDFKFKHLVLPLKWSKKYAGYRLVIDHGLGEEGGSNIEIAQCKVSKIAFNPRKGGTLETGFSVQCADPGTLSETVRGILTGLIQHTDLQIKLLAPSVAQEVEEDEEEEGGDGTVTPESAFQKSIEDEQS